MPDQVTTATAQSEKLTQGILLPVDDAEAQLVEYGDRYSGLTEQQRRLVRAYVHGIRRHGAKFRVKQWAEYSGLPRSTFYERINSEDVVAVAAATREAMVLSGQHDCARASLVLGKAVLFVERLLDEGAITMDTLGKALPVLRDAIAFSSGTLPGSLSSPRARVSIEDAQGRRIDMEVEAGGGEDQVGRALSQLQAGRRRTLRAAAEAADPETVRDVVPDPGEPIEVDALPVPVAEAAG